MLRRCTLICALVAGLVSGMAAPALASRSQMLLFDAPRDLLRDDIRASALDELSGLGVRSLRLVVYWKDVAPNATSRSRPSGDLSDPASYDWSKYDAIMAAAGERGWPVVMTPATPGPKWAMKGRKDFVTRPSASLFGKFVTALGRRYGEQVRIWSIGNEPNHPDFLKPQYAKGKRPLSPRIYRSMFLAADKALKATGNGSDTLLIGETAPRGTGKVVAPLTFLRGVLCLNSAYRRSGKCSRLDADGWAHHPYTTKQGPTFVPPSSNDATLAVLSRLTRALDRSAAAGRIRKGMPLWLTEFGVQSSPDRYFGVSLMKQYEFRATAERMAWFNPRVKAFSQYLLRDDPPIEGVRASARYGGFETGLRFANGRAKPSLEAFKLTLSAQRSGSRVSLWGVVRTATARTGVEVQRRGRKGKRYRTFKTVTTDSRGVLRLTTSFAKGERFRLRWSGETSPPVRVYSR